VIHPEGHALQKVFDKKNRMATEMAGVDGAGGQGRVCLRSYCRFNANGGQAAQAV